MPPGGRDGETDQRRGHPVAGFALTSLLSDVGHEMATAVLPMYLATLGLGATALGAIEGVADFLNGAAKLGGGAAGQVIRRKKPWTAAGYVVTAVGTAAMAFASSLASLLALRSCAWAGRGFRGPLRDFLIADAVEPSRYGRAYGFERAGDMLGAVAGPLIAVALLATGFPFRVVLAASLLPGLLAAVSFVVLVPERPRHSVGAGTRAEGRARLPRGFWPLVTAILAFGLGDFSRSFLILAASRAAGEGSGLVPGSLAIGVPILLYVVHNGVSAATTFPAGKAADRLGRRRVLLAGYALGLACNLALTAVYGSLPGLAFVFVLSGVYIAVEETVEKALVAEMLPREIRSYGLGILATANAAGDMISSLYVGWVWDRVGGGAAFGLAAAFSAAGLLLLFVVGRRLR